MNIQEFSKLANFQVTENYYHEVIEREYNTSNIMDKAEWVKEWKKNGGIQKAYDAMCKEAANNYLVAAENKEKLDQYYEANQNQRKIITELREENFNLRCEKEKNDNLAYFLLDQSEKCSSKELREKVIEMIGFKAYIKYKFDHNMAIWQLDRDEIVKHL